MMWIDALLAYLHFMAIFALFWFLASEWLLLKAGPAALDVERLARADAGFGIAAGAVLLAGLARAVFGVKGLAFYLHNPVFHLKIGLFVAVGLLSIAPTLAFLRWRRARRQDPRYAVPPPEWARVRRLMLIEMHVLALVPLAAVVMARGLGAG